MNARIAALGCTVIAVLATVVAAPAASADTPGCVDSYEFRHTYVGDGKAETERFWDTRGWTVRGQPDRDGEEVRALRSGLTAS